MCFNCVDTLRASECVVRWGQVILYSVSDPENLTSQLNYSCSSAVHWCLMVISWRETAVPSVNGCFWELFMEKSFESVFLWGRISHRSLRFYVKRRIVIYKCDFYAYGCLRWSFNDSAVFLDCFLGKSLKAIIMMWKNWWVRKWYFLFSFYSNWQRHDAFIALAQLNEVPMMSSYGNCNFETQACHLCHKNIFTVNV